MFHVVLLHKAPAFRPELITGDDRWFARFLGWARQIGLWAIVLPAGVAWQPLGYCILAGKSPRGDFAHAVVGWGMQVVHDPHPSRAGIVTCTEVIVLVPMNPAVR